MPVNTAPEPVTEYLILTECGRRLSWSAVGMDQLFRDMKERKYIVTYVKSMTEFQAEIENREQQEDMIAEMREAIEEEMKQSA